MKIGFCGPGLMGAPMVRRLLAAGHEVHVWNRTVAKLAPLAEAGAIIEATPAALAAQSVAICMCLLDAAAVESVVFGPAGIASVTGARWVIDHSSIAPGATQTFASRLMKANGAVWIDAPVSGGVAGAAAGTLAVMAGGPAGAIAQITPLLTAYAARVTHMGPVGAGQATKLCNQTIVAATIAAIGEAVGLARNSGIDPAKLTEALAGGWADSKLLQIFVPRMTAPPEVSIGALDTMLKDLDGVAVLARESGTPMLVSGAVQQAYRLASSLGLGGADLSEIARLSQAGELNTPRKSTP